MNLSKSLNVILGLSLVGLLGYNYFQPNFAKALWAEDYKVLMFNCDQGMRDHYIAKRAVELDASPASIKNLQASELMLTDCHDYDKLRKKMLSWNLTPNDLSLIGIEALEEKEYELQRFVEIHEFRY